MTDLVQRLLHQYEHIDTEKMTLTNPDGPEAVARIEALEAEIERLKRSIAYMAHPDND